MNAFSKKALAGAIGAIALAGAMVASSAPAQAGSRDAAWFAGGVAAGVVGGARVANAHAYPAYGYGYGYPVAVAQQCWREARPIYDRFGNFRGYQKIRVCN
ncbi:MAG: hypothetical protein K2Y29_01150 [Beijerinckiaceae bacterium]|nr:hypothetical protein [Beijerinckiaceae bacterium]